MPCVCGSAFVAIMYVVSNVEDVNSCSWCDSGTYSSIAIEYTPFNFANYSYIDALLDTVAAVLL